ncbi:MAG: hypoxanthine phosphoribosyltransferase [Caldilineae bacterium]|nr:MAG: hypoxanthine phosphoribosyltransferase [Caldilineae bacterium]
MTQKVAGVVVERSAGRPPAQHGPLDEDVEWVLIDSETLQQRVRDLGRFIDECYAGKDLLLIAVLKGSVVFLADLMRAITIPHEVDFMATSSYGAAVQSTGVVRILKDLNKPIEGRHVLIVEDIIDSGHTLAYLTRILAARNPASLHVATLLDKPERREVDIDVKWTGFSIPNEFVIGYGLDYNEKYRNLPYIGVLKPRVYSEAGAPEEGSGP